MNAVAKPIVAMGLLTLFACTRSSTLTPAKDLIGTWQLLEVSGGLRPAVAPPADKPDYLYFNNGGRYKKSIKDSVYEQGTYQLDTGDHPLGPGSVTISMSNFGGGAKQPLVFNNGQLNIGTNIADGLQYTYKRVK